MQINETIARVEHHPDGLVLLLNDGAKDGTQRTRLFLTGATFGPKYDDVVMLNGQTGTILTGKAEHPVKLIRGNILAVTELPEEIHGTS